MKKYETTFIVDSLIKNEEIEGIVSKIEKFISNNGGQIEAVERWGKKRLAYEIKKRQYGYYVHVIFRAHSKLNRLLDREYQLDENILRYLTLMVDPRSEKEALVEQKNDKKDDKEMKTEASKPSETAAEPPSESEDEAEATDAAEETEATKESAPDAAS